MKDKFNLIGGGRNPGKNYGKVEISDILPTILATDYKSPPIVVYEERIDSLEHGLGRECKDDPVGVL